MPLMLTDTSAQRLSSIASRYGWQGAPGRFEELAAGLDAGVLSEPQVDQLLSEFWGASPTSYVDHLAMTHAWRPLPGNREQLIAGLETGALTTGQVQQMIAEGWGGTSAQGDVPTLETVPLDWRGLPDSGPPTVMRYPTINIGDDIAELFRSQEPGTSSDNTSTLVLLAAAALFLL